MKTICINCQVIVRYNLHRNGRIDALYLAHLLNLPVFKIMDCLLVLSNHINIRLGASKTREKCTPGGKSGHRWDICLPICIEIWDHRTVVLSCFSASEIQMMTLPPGQFVITDSGVATPVTTGQVKAVTRKLCCLRVFLFPMLHYSRLPPQTLLPDSSYLS